MSVSAAGRNAEVRAAVLAKVDERLHEMFPDGRPAAAVASFDDLEGRAAVTGDALARELMEQALRNVLAVADADPPERCPDCGTNLKHVEMPKEVATIRGLVGASRVWCHCPTHSVGPTSDADASGRKCRKGFFPR